MHGEVAWGWERTERGASEMASTIRQKKASLLLLSKKLCWFTLMEFHASPKKLCWFTFHLRAIRNCLMHGKVNWDWERTKRGALEMASTIRQKKAPLLLLSKKLCWFHAILKNIEYTVFSSERRHYATFHPKGIFRCHWLSMFTFCLLGKCCKI